MTVLAFIMSMSEIQKKEESVVPGQGSNIPKYSLKVKKPIEIRDTAQVIKDVNEVFEGIGKLKGYQYRIEIDDKVPPVVSSRYSVPPPMQESLKKNLDWMVDIDVIKKETEGTPWVSNTLCTPKHNPKPLNQAVRTPDHYVKHSQDMSSKHQWDTYMNEVSDVTFTQK